MKASERVQRLAERDPKDMEDEFAKDRRVTMGIMFLLALLGLAAWITRAAHGATPAQVDSIAAYYDTQQSQWKEGTFAFTRFSPYVKPLGVVAQGGDVRVTAGYGLSYRYTNWFGASLEQTLVYGKQPRTSLTTKIVLW